MISPVFSQERTFHFYPFFSRCHPPWKWTSPASWWCSGDKEAPGKKDHEERSFFWFLHRFWDVFRFFVFPFFCFFFFSGIFWVFLFFFGNNWWFWPILTNFDLGISLWRRGISFFFPRDFTTEKFHEEWIWVWLKMVYTSSHIHFKAKILISRIVTGWIFPGYKPDINGIIHLRDCFYPATQWDDPPSSSHSYYPPKRSRTKRIVLDILVNSAWAKGMAWLHFSYKDNER